MPNILKYEPFLELSRDDADGSYLLNIYHEVLKRVKFGERHFDANLLNATSKYFGPDAYKICEERYGYISSVLSKINLIWVDDMMVRVYDEFFLQSVSSANFCVFYSTRREDLSGKSFGPNGYLGVNPNDINGVRSKEFVIAHILLEGFSTMSDEYKIKDDVNFINIANCYKPGIIIKIGRYDIKPKDYFSIGDVEKSLDKTLPLITKHLPMDKIIWDMSRGERIYGEETKISDYNVKLILK